MVPLFKHLLGGLGLAVLAITALPMVADSFGAVPIRTAPFYQVNRAIKSDRLMPPGSSVAWRKVPVERLRQVPRPPEEAAGRKPMDGCEPLFSPVTVPALAHLTGRCVG